MVNLQINQVYYIYEDKDKTIFITLDGIVSKYNSKHKKKLYITNHIKAYIQFKTFNVNS